MKPPPCPMISGHREACRRRPARGFSLVEMAIVLVIIGLMLTLMIASGRVMIESKQRSAVKEKL